MCQRQSNVREFSTNERPLTARNHTRHASSLQDTIHNSRKLEHVGSSSLRNSSVML